MAAKVPDYDDFPYNSFYLSYFSDFKVEIMVWWGGQPFSISPIFIRYLFHLHKSNMAAKIPLRVYIFRILAIG